MTSLKKPAVLPITSLPLLPGTGLRLRLQIRLRVRQLSASVNIGCICISFCNLVSSILTFGPRSVILQQLGGAQLTLQTAQYPALKTQMGKGGRET